ncbi:OmpA family protein [Paraflavisolibacter sp. H34]|uniref:OmpA family protein n=1 Tax=Huijunlia imazamoxiresistens TaxID=3127457 RepID=UPI003015A6E3
MNKKAKEAHQKAYEKAMDGQYNEAVLLLQEAVQKDPKFVEAYLSLAGVYSEQKKYSESIATYEKAFALDTAFTSEYRLPYSIALARQGAFDKALEAVNALLATPAISPNTKKSSLDRQKAFQFAVDFARNAPKDYVFQPVNLGASVNTAESEYFPSLPVNGTELIFTRRLNRSNEDFFLTQKEGGGWSPSHRLNGSINTAENEGGAVIAQDGQWLVFTGCNREGGKGSCDIYISYATPQGWSEAANLGAPVNTGNMETQPCLSPDKRDLYFASNRPGGLGGTDIYRSRLQPNGKWSEPENLGPGINTPGDEVCPFIHADNQTLYFASNGWPGYGDHDLFLARRQPGGAWGAPRNLGYPVNTIDREGTLFVAADGSTAYYASDRADSKGGLDLYSFALRPDLQPRKTLWVKGKVFDSKTNKGLPSAVELVDLATREVVSKVQTDETGNYLLTLPVGSDYAFNVARRGYLFYSGNFPLRGKTPDSTYQKDIPLQPLELNASVVLNNIFFDFSKFELRPESQVELDRVVQLLHDNPDLTIQIAGYTDNVGNAADNLKLSENRAKAVVAYLASKGIAPKRLTYKGYGAAQPISDNSTEEGRARNRRTELKVTGK